MPEVKLITELNENVHIITESESKNLYVEGIYSTAELKNKNGRRYKKATLQREIDKLKPTIERKALYGELDHPSSPTVNPMNTAILIESLDWKGDDVIGRAIVLDTPAGKTAKAIMQHGALGISSRGLGSVNEDGYVNDNSYRLITWDLVMNPSNHPSWLNGIYEAKSWNVEEFEQVDGAKEFGDVVVDSLAEADDVTVAEAKEVYRQYIINAINSIAKNI